MQTHWVIQQLQQLWSNLEITIVQIRTTGDRVTSMPLAQIGGDGVFVLEIERALHERRIDVAVHSLKDLPTAQPQGLRLVTVGPREDVRDVLVFNHQNNSTLTCETSSRIGTCSLRRTAQIRAQYPMAQILPIRGNVDTRLRKLDANEYDGIVLAAAGLHRLDMRERLAGRITYFPIESMMPAPGQGALALEIRDESAIYELLAPLNDLVTQTTTTAERMFLRRLGGGCYLPVAAYGELSNDLLTLSGRVISLDGQRQVRVCQRIHWTPQSAIEQAEQLGITLAEQALAQGADEIIQTIDVIQAQEPQRV
ncbi:MAG: hydroxymethylbilane synthase [Ktedonobacteraceae bacterium]